MNIEFKINKREAEAPQHSYFHCEVLVNGEYLKDITVSGDAELKDVITLACESITEREVLKYKHSTPLINKGE